MTGALPVPPTAAEVAVVLGAAVRRDGSPSAPLRRRIDRAIALWHAGAVGRLLCSGGRGRYPPAEAELMRQRARRAGVADDCLLVEPHSRSTWDNARLCAPLLRRHRLRRIVLVSDAYHLPRARLAFRHFGVVAAGCAAAPASGRRRLRQLPAYLREAVALIWYLARIAACRLRTG